MATFTTRPVIMGTRGVVTSGHYLATAAGFRIMEQGGNAVDAAAAMMRKLLTARERVGTPREATGRAESKWAGPDGVVIDISEPGWAV